MRKLLLFGVATFLILASCRRDDEDAITTINHKIDVKFTEEFGNKPAPNAELTLLNKETSQKYTARTGVEGKTVVNLVPGTYTIQATLTLSSEEMKSILGIEEEQTTFNDSAQEVTIDKETNETTKLTIIRGKSGNLLIKQLYYSGSHRKLGSSFRDQFFEIHNNSNETLYLDGLCFAQIYGERKIPSTLESYHLPNGQYDFSKSFGNKDLGSKANTDYVYADEVISFPGTGKDHPIESGKSVLVATTALNHKEPLVVQVRGKERVYKAEDPSLTVDLSNAKFETYMANYPGNPGWPYDIDTPAENMKILYKESAGRDLFLHPFGVDAFVIFYANESDIQEWKKVPSPSIPEDRLDRAKRYLRIPNNIIIDGVELQNYQDAKPKPKRLQKYIDAGEVKGIKGGYTSESAIRKVKRRDGDRVFYQDTNNSSIDFEIIDHPNTDSLNK